ALMQGLRISVQSMAWRNEKVRQAAKNSGLSSGTFPTDRHRSRPAVIERSAVLMRRTTSSNVGQLLQPLDRLGHSRVPLWPEQASLRWRRLHAHRDRIRGRCCFAVSSGYRIVRSWDVTGERCQVPFEIISIEAVEHDRLRIERAHRIYA